MFSFETNNGCVWNLNISGTGLGQLPGNMAELKSLKIISRDKNIINKIPSIIIRFESFEFIKSIML
ncbi:MAG: hypothetical protein JW891_07220 [Candidatus Lokiarchaeota archaeon]|nr:hypothetical protein [Candidatus Lokiarchaeota archaeon]